MAYYQFGKIKVAVSKIPTPQDWLVMKLIERHANDTFYSHYLSKEKNEKRLNKLEKIINLPDEEFEEYSKEVKELVDQVKIDNHLGHLWWLHNVRALVVSNVEYTQWVFDLYKELPDKFKKECDEKEWFNVASSIVEQYGPKLEEIIIDKK